MSAKHKHINFRSIGYFTWFTPEPLKAHYIQGYEPSTLYHIKFAVHPGLITYDIYINDMYTPVIKGAPLCATGGPDTVKYHAEGNRHSSDVRALVNVNFIRKYTSNEPTVTFQKPERYSK